MQPVNSSLIFYCKLIRNFREHSKLPCKLNCLLRNAINLSARKLPNLKAFLFAELVQVSSTIFNIHNAKFSPWHFI